MLDEVAEWQERPLEQSEGARFRLRVMTELKTRGVNDALIAVWTS